MKDNTVYLSSLGCAKNTVDSASMVQLLEREGFCLTTSPRQASILVVNTCGFIEAARKESFSTLRSLAKGKRNNQLLIAAGCLPQRVGEEVARQVNGIDGVLGTSRWMDIVHQIRRLKKQRQDDRNKSVRHRVLYHLPESPVINNTEEKVVMRASISGTSAYLKIADGCRRPCAFCSIPLIKGTAVSRPMEKIIQDARTLQAMGMHELVIIAQDTTDYGYDLGMKDGLANLLENILLQAPGIEWLRILYAYPGYVTDRLIDVMACHKQILPYLDIPLQHASPATLGRMRRPADMQWVHSTIGKMRAAMPELAIRTTFIVGYPGETESEFQELLDFVKEMRFDRVGAFKFSFEPGTASEVFGDPIPAEVKEERYQRLMEMQQGISLQINQSFVGKTMDVLVEGRQENGIAIGRSYRDAPEIDGMVLIEGGAEPGTFTPVRITGALEYDLTAQTIKG
jgi:ribosomal protein S12 methylthiotransferase